LVRDGNEGKKSSNSSKKDGIVVGWRVHLGGRASKTGSLALKTSWGSSAFVLLVSWSV
jgi:hypothetical protein